MLNHTFLRFSRNFGNIARNSIYQSGVNKNNEIKNHIKSIKIKASNGSSLPLTHKKTHMKKEVNITEKNKQTSQDQQHNATLITCLIKNLPFRSQYRAFGRSERSFALLKIKLSKHIDIWKRRENFDNYARDFLYV